MSDNLFALDDAAARALWELAGTQHESIGLLYQGSEGLLATDPQSREHAARARGSFAIPSGSLRGIFHNHPERRKRRGDAIPSRRDRMRTEFSEDDIIEAQRLGVPSYIAAGPKLRRYDPATGETQDVLAEIPIDVIRAELMMRY